jgi:hypothetical protein
MAQRTHIRLNNGIDIPRSASASGRSNRDAPKVVGASTPATAPSTPCDLQQRGGCRRRHPRRRGASAASSSSPPSCGTTGTAPEAFKAFDRPERLQVEYVDLYLVHWPTPRANLYVETWAALQEIKQTGRTKAVGVSNFKVPHLERLIGETGIVPAINQIELHPRFQQKEQCAFHAKHQIVTRSWSRSAGAA